MIDPLILLAALLTGVAGAGHCFGMCGGIAGALAQAIPGDRAAWRMQLAFSAGRLTTYALLGALAGATAMLLSSRDAAIAVIVTRVFAGVLMLAVGAYLLRLFNALSWIEQAGSHVWRRVSPLARRLLPVDTLPRALALGFIWGLMPCGLLYGALLFAATAGSAMAGALTMLAFGAGTLPAVLSLGLAAAVLRRHASLLRHGSGALLLVWGAWTLLATWLASPGILDGSCRSPADVLSRALTVLMHINEAGSP